MTLDLNLFFKRRPDCPLPAEPGASQRLTPASALAPGGRPGLGGVRGRERRLLNLCSACSFISDLT